MNVGELLSQLKNANDDVRVYIDNGSGSAYGDAYGVSMLTKKCDAEGCDHEHITGFVIHVEPRKPRKRP